MPVGEMVQRMSSSELTEWAAYLSIKHAEEEKARKDAESQHRRRR
jgi:hypothetical protein